MDRFRLEFRASLPFDGATQACERALTTPQRRITGREERALFWREGRLLYLAVAVEIVVKPLSETEPAIAYAGSTRVGGRFRRRNLTGQFKTRFQQVAARAPIEPAVPNVERLPPFGAEPHWLLRRRN